MRESESLEKIIGPEKSEDIILKIIINRHGPKLKAAGEKNTKADYFADWVKQGFDNMNIKAGKGLVHISSSPVERAEHSAKIMKNELDSTEHRGKGVYLKKELEVPYQPSGEAKNKKYAEDFETIIEMQKNIEPSIREKVSQECADLTPEEQEAEIRNIIDIQVLTEMFNDSQRNQEQKKFKTSYCDLADNFASRYLGFSKYLDVLNNLRADGKQPAGEPYLQIDVSHSFPITSFLKKYLVFEDGQKADDLDSKTFFEKTGGVIGESESLVLDYIKKGDKKIIKVSGKNFTGYINYEQ